MHLVMKSRQMQYKVLMKQDQDILEYLIQTIYHQRIPLTNYNKTQDPEMQIHIR